MLPFTREQFFGVFAAYNQFVWPAQIVMIALAVAVVAAARWSPRAAWPGWAVSALWSWIGLVYHIGFFSRINPAAYAFGAMFVLQALVFGWLTFRGELRFAVPRDGVARWTGAALLLYALVGYPVLAHLSGQRYPAVPTFGLPCPTTIFTFGMLAWSVRPVRIAAVVLPLLWAAVATSAAAKLGVVEDWGLPLAAVALLTLRFRRGSLRATPLAAGRVT